MHNFAPLRGPYEGTRAAYHSLIVGRIYHEDLLFAQRSYVLLGVHAFLMTGFTVLVTAPKDRMSALTWLIAFSIPSLGSVLGTFQASFGQQTGRAIGFWREYARLIEHEWQTPFDHLQYEFYAKAKAETAFGIIASRKVNQKALYESFRRFRFLTSIVTTLGVVFPAGLALFWNLALAFVVQQLTRRVCASVSALLLFLLPEIALILLCVAPVAQAVSPVSAREPATD